jgi:hypothetical protein
MAATNQLANNVALVAGTRLVNLKASAATFVIPKKLWPSHELHNKSAIYFFRYLWLQLINVSSARQNHHIINPIVCGRHLDNNTLTMPSVE